MKRFSALIFAIFMLLTMTILPGCNQNTSSGGKTRVVCTIFPQYDWVRQILGDKSEDIELTLLIDNKVDLHSYQPSVEDIAKVSSCDLFIYVGGESDAWVRDALKSATNKNMTVINLLEVLGNSAKEEEIKDGMEHEHEHEESEHHENEHEHEESEHHENEHEHEESEHHENEHEHSLDEHVWLSLKNAEIFCSIITGALSSLNAENADTYKSNLTAYNEKLSALDAEYQSVADTASVKTVLFADRFPFRYLVDDYGLDYHAAFIGCSAETEASFETIIFLSEKIDELGLKNIIVTESSDQSIAKTVKNNTTDKNQEILTLDSMQSVSGADITNGMTYLSVMESNLNILKDALR